MIIKSREIEIPEDDPFANDVLERKESAEILTEFVTSSEEPMVICIDAPWGMGKTTFLKIWKQHLKNEGIPTLYFNAWESDFSDDALVCLIGEISASINEISKDGNESKAKEYFDKAKKLGSALLKRSIPVLAKMGTMGALDLDQVTEATLSDFAESLAKEQIEHYEKSKQGLLAFRETLSNFASSITSENDQKPLVFIIDELDRCRPNFAIEILEKAKHFFNVENIIFVLGVDKEQLGSSIKAIYGDSLNVNGYLRRFIDFDYLLPQPAKGKFIEILLKKYSIHDLLEQRENDIKASGREVLNYTDDLKDIQRIFTEMPEEYDLTLREQIHCISLFNIALKFTPENESIYSLFVCSLIVLKIKEPEKYKKLIAGKIKKLSQLWANDVIGNAMSTSYYGIVLNILVACVMFNKITEEDFKKDIHRRIHDDPNPSGYYRDRMWGLIRKYNIESKGVKFLEAMSRRMEIVNRFSN